MSKRDWICRFASPLSNLGKVEEEGETGMAGGCRVGEAFIIGGPSVMGGGSGK